MAYPGFTSTEDIVTNLERKERYALIKRDKPVTSVIDGLEDVAWYSQRRLEFHVNQVIAAMVTNPNTTLRRLLIKYGVGNGKTLTAILVTLGFTRIYRSLPNDMQPRIYFVGYTESIIKEALLAHPELGFMSHAERLELNALAEAAKNGNRIAGEQYVTLLNRIRQRIVQPRRGGYFRFYGYIQLASLLFNIKDAETTDVAMGLVDGTIQINEHVRDKFKGSVIVCDESHELYNTQKLNNAGLAIQYLLDYHGTDVTAIFMSATIINNSPSEIVDAANLLRMKNEPKLEKTALFTPDPRARVLPGKLPEIAKAFVGRVLTLEETGTDYPELHYVGDEIPGLPLLKFTTAPMSRLHANTYATTQAYEYNTLESDEKTVLDMVFPNPKYSAKELEDPKTTAIGLYRSADILSMATTSSSAWRSSVGLEYVSAANGNVGYFTGPWLHRKRLGTYSLKLLKFVKECRRIVKHDVGKIFAWHEKVKLGIIIAQQCLLMNGFIDETSDPTPDTLCTVCGKTMAKNTCERFRPARVITIHGMIPAKQIDRLVAEYSSPHNNYGQNYRIILGSTKVKQSFNFLGTRHVISISVPVNIAMFLQFTGRAYRRGSQLVLKPKHRQLYVHTLMTLGGIEQTRYEAKLNDYKEMAIIEQAINALGLNNYINDSAERRHDPLASLPYKPAYLPKRVGSDITFRAYGYYEQEVATIVTIIKRLFLSIPVWKIEDLWKCVQRPPFRVDRRCEVFARGNFDIALRGMLHHQDIGSFRYSIADASDVFRTFEETSNKLFTFEYRNGAKATGTRVITCVGEYLILAPYEAAAVVDLDCFLASKIDSPLITVPITVSSERRNEVSMGRLGDYVTKPHMILVDFSPDFHQYALRNHVEGTKKLPKQIEALYRKLKLLGDGYYVWSRKMLFKRGWVPQPRDEDTRVENDKYIGFIEHQQFKIRRPRQVIQRELDRTSLDLRKVERGIKCSSIRKNDIPRIARDLGLKNIEGIGAKDFCSRALARLVELESTDKDCRWLYPGNEEHIRTY
jgi:hypothetical protein